MNLTIAQVLNCITIRLGFRNVCTLEDIIKAYPLLDMVDHDNRKRIVRKLRE